MSNPTAESKALQKLAKAFKNPFKRETEKARLVKLIKVGTLLAGWEFYSRGEINFESIEEEQETKLITVYPPRQSWHTYAPEPLEMYALGVSGIILRQVSVTTVDWEIKWLGCPDREPEIWSAEGIASAHLNYLNFEKNNFLEISPTEGLMDWNNNLAIALKIVQ